MTKNVGKYRARILLPAEMLLYLTLLILAISGATSHWALWQAIERGDDTAAWIVVVGLVGAGGLAVTAWEWIFGEHWACSKLLQFAAVRMWASLFAITVWGYVLHTLFTSPAGTEYFAIGAVGIGAIVFHLWAVVTLKRLYVLLHPDFPTSHLEARLENGNGNGNGGG